MSNGGSLAASTRHKPVSLFAIIVKRARDQQQKNARMERERLKRRI
jgi:hypothetical protein